MWIQFLFGVTATLGAMFIAPSAAQAAEDHWRPIRSTCSGNRWVVIDFTVRNSYVKVGWGPDVRGAGLGSWGWRSISPPGSSIYTSRRDVTWQVWASPGDVTSWRVRCVNYD